MIFRTDIKGRRTVEEYLECKECNNQMFSQVDCCTRCKGDDLKWMTQYTVYKVVYAEDEGDAVETALDMMTDFELLIINIKVLARSEGLEPPTV